MIDKWGPLFKRMNLGIKEIVISPTYASHFFVLHLTTIFSDEIVLFLKNQKMNYFNDPAQNEAFLKDEWINEINMLQW